MTLFAFSSASIIGTELENERESVVIRWDPPGNHFVVVETESSGEIRTAYIRTDNGVAEKSVRVVKMVEEESGAWGGAWMRTVFLDSSA
jgi:hypothetical protein